MPARPESTPVAGIAGVMTKQTRARSFGTTVVLAVFVLLAGGSEQTSGPSLDQVKPGGPPHPKPVLSTLMLSGVPGNWSDVIGYALSVESGVRRMPSEGDPVALHLKSLIRAILMQVRS